MADELPHAPERVRGALRQSSDFLSPFNAIVVAAVTLLDIATPSLDKGASRLIALVAAVLVAVLLYRVHVARLEAGRTPGASAARAFFARGANTFLLLLIPFAIGMAWAGSAWASSRGVVATAVPLTQAAQDALFEMRASVGEMKADVKAINRSLNPVDARGRLEKMHYGLDDESKARAIESCDLDALKLYVEAREPLPEAVPVFGVRGGSVLEKPIATRNPRLPEVLRLLASQGMRFDARYPLTFTQAQSAAIPQFAGLSQSVPAPLRLGFMPSLVNASPLAVAVWFDNAEAAGTLAALGADPAVGVDALLPQTHGGQIVGGPSARQISSAAQEAQRLGRSSLLAVKGPP